VILWGALVRATGSGAGCGGHWPLCNGEALPQIAANATAIEFTHRVMSAVALIVVVALFAWARALYPRGHSARRWAAWSLVFILTEALLGASLVLLGHVAADDSVGRVYSLGAHLINTFALLASLALTAWTSTPPDHGASNPLAGLTPLLAIVAVAVSGAITALGDTLFPAHTLAQGLRDDFSATANFLIRLRIVHPLLALAAGGFLAVWAGREYAARRTHQLRWLSGTLLALVAFQMMVGAGNILLKAPLAMQLLHLLLADGVWITLVLLTAEWNRLATDTRLPPDAARMERQ
jgi:heme a synthase